MTSEQRLDRLERIAKLFVTAGLRARRNMREQDEKIDIIINLQIQNEERFQKNEERFRENEERFRRNEERFRDNEERFRRNEERFARTDQRFAAVVEAQANSDRRLDSLIDIIRDGRNGNS